MSRKTDSENSANYAEKRKAVKFTTEFYLDDAFEKQIYNALKNEPRGHGKKVILEALAKHYGLVNERN